MSRASEWWGQENSHLEIDDASWVRVPVGDRLLTLRALRCEGRDLMQTQRFGKDLRWTRIARYVLADDLADILKASELQRRAHRLSDRDRLAVVASHRSANRLLPELVEGLLAVGPKTAHGILTDALRCADGPARDRLPRWAVGRRLPADPDARDKRIALALLAGHEPDDVGLQRVAVLTTEQLVKAMRERAAALSTRF